MSRSIAMHDGDPVFRAVIRGVWADGQPFARREGPYGSAAQAKARVTFWRNHLAKNGGTAAGRVERGTVSWSPVDPGGKEL